MFAIWPVAGRRLPKNIWEPLRRLNDEHRVPLETLSDCFGVPRQVMLQVLHSARSAQLRGDEGRWWRELGGGPDADAVPARV